MNRWCHVIAREVASQYQTKTERDAAVEFVRQHRLSIANAFERRIVRGDVVAALARMFEDQKDDNPVHGLGRGNPSAGED